MSYITHNIKTNEEIEKLGHIFKNLDIDGDGKISIDDLKESMRKNYGFIDQHKAEELVNEIHGEKKGGIEYEEFLRSTLRKSFFLTEDNLKQAFDLFENHTDHTIDASTVKKILSNDQEVSDEVVQDLLKEIDKSPEEKINFEDFKKLMYKSMKLGDNLWRTLEISNSKDSIEYNESNYMMTK